MIRLSSSHVSSFSFLRLWFSPVSISPTATWGMRSATPSSLSSLRRTRKSSGIAVSPLSTSSGGNMKKQKKTKKANIFVEHLFLVGWVQSLAQLHYYSLRLMDCALFRKELLFHQLFSTLEVFLSITITLEHFVTKHSARSPSIGKLPTLSCFPRKHCNTFLFKLGGGESLRLHQVVEEVEECKQWRMHSNPHFVQPQVKPRII